MDFSWLTQFLNWIIQVNTFISNFTSLLGSFTLLGAGVGYVLSRRDSGFGPKYKFTARYTKFFKPIADELPERDPELTPRKATVATNFANYDSTKNLRLRYRAHFVPGGKFGVYLMLTTKDMKDAKAVWESLEKRKKDIGAQLGLDKKPGFFARLIRRGGERGELKWETLNSGQYRVTLYYPSRKDELTIASSGRKLKRVRSWALDSLIKFQQAFDPLVPEVRKELHRRQTADAILVPVAAAR